MADNYIRSLNGYKLKDEIARDQIANLQASLDDHNHDDSYENKADASSKLAEAKSYTDSEVGKVTSGTIIVKEAEHAESADSATTATNATNANHAATADSATSATTAGSATKATQDGNGKVIADTYQTIEEASSQHNSLQSAIDSKATSSDISSAVSVHNTNTSAHNDIRDLISGLTARLNALANSTDEDLDQMAEIVAYIKSNKSLIDSITTSKVNVADIVNNLTTNVTNKPLSAAQGVTIKALIDEIDGVIDSHTKNINNPHGVTAAQVGAYTKAEVDSTVLTLNVAIGGKANEVHTHEISSITNLRSELDALQDSINNMSAGAPVFTDDGEGNVTLSNSTLDNALYDIENGYY